MRDIIFRGKRLDNGEWLYGSLLISHFKDDKKERYFITQFSGNYTFEHEVAPATVGQYTGMKDKNGKKIFEGDIMSLVTEFGDTIIREIRFIDGAFCVIGEQEDDLHGLSWAVEMCDGIVGDNIHDNPDLLK